MSFTPYSDSRDGLSDAEVVGHLIDYYKSKGVDLSKVLSNPVFDKLPVKSKLEAIRIHARTLHEGSKPGLGSDDKAHIAATSLFAGVTGAGVSMGVVKGVLSRMQVKGIPLATSMGTNKAMALTILSGVAGGAVAGAFAGLLDRTAHVQQRNNVIRQLGATANNPTYGNAIGVISAPGLSDQAVNVLSSRIQNYILPQVEQAHRQGLPSTFLNNYEKFNNTRLPQTFFTDKP